MSDNFSEWFLKISESLLTDSIKSQETRVQETREKAQVPFTDVSDAYRILSIGWDCSFAIIGVDAAESAVDVINGNDDGFFYVEEGRLRRNYYDYVVDCVVEDFTNKKGVLFSGAFG